MSSSSISYSVVSTSGGSNSVQDFRLTLTSNTPVMTSGVLAATTLYLTPYVGNKIALYNGSTWDIVSSSQVSLSLAGLPADTNYDIFAYNLSGTVALETLAWGNSGAGTSVRSNSLVHQDGVLVKSGDNTRRYIGTIRTTGTTGQCQFSFGAIGSESKLFVWNYYNRRLTKSFVSDSSASWTFTSSSDNQYRAANNNPAFRVSFVYGVLEDTTDADYIVSAHIVGGGNKYSLNGVGLNSTTVASGSSMACQLPPAQGRRLATRLGLSST